jgi:alpha-glucosidase
MKHRSITLFIIGILAPFCTLAAKKYTVAAPWGRIKATVETSTRLYLDIKMNGKPLLEPSIVDLTLNNDVAVFDHPKVKKVRRKKINQVIDAPLYRQKSFSLEGNEMTLLMDNGWGIRVIATEEGVAYRLFTTKEGDQIVKNENSIFNFGKGKKSWLSYSTNQKDPFAMAFQATYSVSPLDSAKQQLAFLPATVDCGQAKVTLMESDVKNYPCMFVRPDQNGELNTVLPPYPKKMAYYPYRHMTHVVEREPYIARITGPRELPWRIFAIAEHDTDMPVNNLVYALASPNRIGDVSWVKPGKVAWDWWNDWNLHGVDFRAGINQATYKYYIDFAAKYHLPYIILDEGWYDAKSGDLMHPIDALNLPELIEYGRERGVGIVLWTVFNVLDEHLEEACDHYAKMGIKGWKVDFMDRNDQTAVEMVERIADVSARHHLILDLHGIYTPVGLDRTYPNIVNYESVFGMEEVKWGKIENDHPRYDVTFPFIRLQSGRVDFTPGAMRNGTPNTWKAVYSEPISQGTRCHQAAEYIVYDSPFTMLCDAPTNYEAEPEYTTFLASLPDEFDETRVLQGELGEYIVTARRKGSTWYIGGLTNWTPRDLTIDLKELGELPPVKRRNILYTLLPIDVFNVPMKVDQYSLLQDGHNADRNAQDYQLLKDQPAKDSLQVHLAPGGGFVAVVKYKNEEVKK